MAGNLIKAINLRRHYHENAYFIWTYHRWRIGHFNRASRNITFGEELYSGMSATAIQKDQQANPAAERHSTAKAACAWHEAESIVVDSTVRRLPQ